VLKTSYTTGLAPLSRNWVVDLVRQHTVESTVRPSLALYNTREEIDALVATLLRLQAGRGHRKL